MRKHASRPINDVLQECLYAPKYRLYWVRSVVVTAWRNLFPHTKDQLARISMKGHTIFVKLKSLILTNDLRRSKEEILQKLQTEIVNMGHQPSIIQDIVFV